ncbi:MAG: amidohydrolase [Candidatus Omnitrophica bacterium]|nr:amidohydrolase [Candidatus Omnitrophota bacterium]
MKREELSFYDANLVAGSPMTGGWEPLRNKKEILKSLDWYRIEKALVWHISQVEYSATEGNKLVSSLVKGEERLMGCWAVLPPVTGELEDRFFERMRENNIKALRFFPEQHRFLLRRRVFGSFLDEVAERKIPVILSVKWGLNWSIVYQFLEDYPQITCVLSDLGIWGTNRLSWPLLAAFPDLYLESSLLSLTAGALEATVKKFGAQRILWGTGFPERYAEAAIFDLLQAEIEDREKLLISRRNLELLLARVRL